MSLLYIGLLMCLSHCQGGISDELNLHSDHYSRLNMAGDR
jgi:hypothetical protein